MNEWNQMNRLTSWELWRRQHWDAGPTPRSFQASRGPNAWTWAPVIYILSPFFFHFLPSFPEFSDCPLTLHVPVQDFALPSSGPGPSTCPPTSLSLPTPNPVPDSCLRLLGVVSMIKLIFPNVWVTARAVSGICGFFFLTFMLWKLSNIYTADRRV